MKTSEIAELVGGELRGDGAIEITACAAVDRATAGEIAFLDGKVLPETVCASCVLVPREIDTSSDVPMIFVDRPKLAFARVAAELHPSKGTKTRDAPYGSCFSFGNDRERCIHRRVYVCWRRLTDRRPNGAAGRSEGRR